MINAAEHLGLVHGIIRRKFSGTKIEYDELFAEGSLALVEAATRFDESKGILFSTYASSCIQGRLLHYLRESIIKIPRADYSPHLADTLVCSLDLTVIGLDGSVTRMSDYVPDRSDFVEMLQSKQMRAEVMDYIEDMEPGRTKDIVTDYILALTGETEELTQKEIAERHDTSQQDVCRQLAKHLSEIKKQLILLGYGEI